MRSTVSGTVKEYRDHCQSNISLANRYKLIIGATFLTFCFMKRHAMRRTFFMFGGLTWFLLPEWGSAYLRPRKSLAELLSEAQIESKPADLPTIDPPKAVSDGMDDVARLRAEAEKLI